MDILEKIKESFIAEFGKLVGSQRITRLEVDGDIGLLDIASGSHVTSYWCKLTSRGVKKGSWRIDRS